MMFFRFLSLTACLLLLAACGTAPAGDSAGLAEKSYKVWGNCEQCKETIEAAAALPGIGSASWSEDTKLLTIKIDTAVVNGDAVLKAVAAAGYDNERYTADNQAYANLPECCQYERRD